MDTPTQEFSTQETVVQPVEAGFSTNMFLYHPKMGRLQFTFRGATSRDWGLVLEDIDRFAHYMLDKGWKFDGALEASPPAKATEQPKPAADGPKPAGAGQAKPPIDTSINTMEIAKVKVEPQADGKIKIGLFAKGHQYADLFINAANYEAALKLLANTGYEWDAEYLNKVAEYDMHFFADWRNSDKLNSKGNPYKNVVALRSAEATA